MEIKDRVTANIEAFGLTGEIKAGTMKHLIKIDEVLETMTTVQANAVQSIKDNKISINRVAKESDIARQTFYNNPLLTAYIEKYLAAHSIDSPYETIEALREDIRRKDEQISKMVQRDATVSKYKAKNQALTDEIASLQATIRSQEDLIRQLRSGKTIKLHNS